MCLPRSMCVNEVGSYKCACEEGFTATYSDDKQVFCEDLNECERDANICSEKGNSFCVNTFGSYDCQCEPSFKDISGICASVCDIKECENGATCIISNEAEIPEAYCMCPPGYEGEKCAERSHLFKVAVSVGTTFIILSCLLFVTSVLLACLNQRSKTYPDEDQSIDGGWDESKGKDHEDREKPNGGHTSTEKGLQYVAVQKEGPNGTALSTLNNQPSGSTTKIQVEPNSYF
ncbi:fibrillin-1-like [Anneissia japonica]|uniref:fibrillin-1-like n=1 Tax=Anneissia japonica TaxID=1529436 RepID=UPI001425A4C1|nr:fibrillin-1-like [Anneissia japonica]